MREEIASARETWNEIVKDDYLLSILSWNANELVMIGLAVRSFLRWVMTCLFATCEPDIAVQDCEAKQPELLIWELLPIFKPVPKTEELGSSARSDSTVTAPK